MKAGERPRRTEEGQINSTARWPERLEQVATLLRSEAAAILALAGDEVHALFSAPADDPIPWSRIVGEDAVRRAIGENGGFAIAIAAERWGDSAAYALLVPLSGTAGERGVLCAARRGLPFDAVEVMAGEAAARLLSMAFSDAQAVAQMERTTPRPSAPDRLPLRVLVIDDHPATRIGLESLLASGGFDVVAACGSVAEAIQRLAVVRPDLAIVDLSLPDAAAPDAVERLRAAAPGLSVLTFGDEPAAEPVRSALRAGAVGHIGKDAPPARIAAALLAAAAGLAPIDPAALEAIVAARERSPERPPAPLMERNGPERAAERPVTEPPDRSERVPAAAVVLSESLSPRELELLRYLAEGYTNKEIARVMVLAEDTVKKGVQSVIAKLGAADRTHAVVLALRSGIIE